jgi:hypothetical protein
VYEAPEVWLTANMFGIHNHGDIYARVDSFGLDIVIILD